MDTDTSENPSLQSKYVKCNSIVGSGAYKVVYEGINVYSGMKVAWNVVKLNNLSRSEKKMILNEIMILNKISGLCSEIMKFYTAWVDDYTNSLIFISELGNYTLNTYIKKVEIININLAKKWAVQILKGLDFLHSRNIIHRDIKSTNIFVITSSGNIIIGDFGTARVYKQSCETIIGTPLFMAPEIYSGSYNDKIDIYAFGLCLIEIITGKIPFEEYFSLPIFVSCLVNASPKIIQEIENTQVKEIVIGCLDLQPENRKSASELLNNPFFVVQEEIYDDVNIKKINKKLTHKPKSHKLNKIINNNSDNSDSDKNDSDKKRGLKRKNRVMNLLEINNTYTNIQNENK